MGHYFWGRLDSFFTVALINHLACIGLIQKWETINYSKSFSSGTAPTNHVLNMYFHVPNLILWQRCLHKGTIKTNENTDKTLNGKKIANYFSNLLLLRIHSPFHDRWCSWYWHSSTPNTNTLSLFQDAEKIWPKNISNHF